MTKESAMKLVDLNGVMFLSHKEHSIQMSSSDVTTIRAMDINAAREWLRSQHTLKNRKLNDALRAIERDIDQLHPAIENFLSRSGEPDDGSIEI